jgi:hypothetical protein
MVKNYRRKVVRSIGFYHKHACRKSDASPDALTATVSIRSQLSPQKTERE